MYAESKNHYFPKNKIMYLIGSITKHLNNISKNKKLKKALKYPDMNENRRKKNIFDCSIQV